MEVEEEERKCVGCNGNKLGVKENFGSGSQTEGYALPGVHEVDSW